jgi:hypothetical protein
LSSLGEGFAVVGTVAAVTGYSVESVFLGATRIIGCMLIFAVWALARSVGSRSLPAAMAAVVAALSFHVLKVPLFWYTLIDIEACLVMVWAMHLLLVGRTRSCLVMACVGVLLKEFLVIPAMLALLAMAWSRPRRSIAAIAMGGLLLAFFILLPRLVLPIAKSFQAVDPMHAAGWLHDLGKSFAPARWARVGYSMLAFFAPVLMLISKQRLEPLRRMPRARAYIASVFLGLLTLLSLLGGSDIPRFAVYALPLQAIGIATLLADEPLPYRRSLLVELAVVAGATFVFNRIWISLPHPTIQLAAFVDAYSGHAASPDARLMQRTWELLATIALGTGLAHVARQRL